MMPKWSVATVLTVALAAIPACGPDDLDESSNGQKVVEVGDASFTENVDEATQRVERIGTDWWGFTECYSESEAETMIAVFLAGVAGSNIPELKQLPWPWADVVSTVGTVYWGSRATEFRKALDTRGSRGVCVDWTWFPTLHQVRPWLS